MRRRVGVGLVLTALVALVAYLATPSSSSPRAPSPRSAGAPGKPAKPAVPLVFHLAPAPWHLATALSRAVALPSGGKVRVLGGLGPANVSSRAVVDIDPTTGQSQPAGSLAAPVHDAAGAVIGGRDVVFGGGAGAVVATVQSMGASAADTSAEAGAVATLPSPRADLAAVATGGTTVIAGGYDGKSWLADVLSTTDGTTFSVVARLPQAVRYPAVAAVGSKVYVIGGELPAQPPEATSVQVVDLST